MTGPSLSRRTVLAGIAASLPCGAGATTAIDEGQGLASVIDTAMLDGASSVLVARSGEILIERYASGWNATRPREVASVAKSIVAVLIGMAVDDGAIEGFDQPACDFIPAWRDDPRAAITFRRLMSMTSGLDDTGLALRGVTGNQFAINSSATLRDPPGSRWAYNTAAYHLLFHLLARATGEAVAAYAGRRLLDPVGMSETSWITNETLSATGAVTNYYSAASTARDLFRFGSLILQEGRDLVRPATVRALITPSQRLNPSYGLLWWTNARQGFDAAGQSPGVRFPSAPSDTIAALGAGGQAVLLVPSLGLTVVRQGDPPRSAQSLDALLGSILDVLNAA